MPKLQLVLYSLPEEVIVHILYYTFLDVGRSGCKLFTSVCKADPMLRDICLNSPIIRYQLALNAYGMVDGDSTRDAATKLEELNRRERSWRELSFSELTRKTIPAPFHPSQIYDLSSGVYLLGQCKRDLRLPKTHSLRIIDLHEAMKSDASPVWPEFTVDADIVDIGFCLHEFDLLAVVGQRAIPESRSYKIILFFIELSTGHPHPYARVKEMPLGDAQREWGRMSIMLEVVGPRLILMMSWQSTNLFSEVDDVLMLINWQRGNILVYEHATYGTWNGFVFLTDDTIMLPNLSDSSLEIVSLPEKAEEKFTRMACFKLPPLGVACTLNAVSCRCEPNPLGTNTYDPNKIFDEDQQVEIAQAKEARARRPIGSHRPDPKQAIVLMQLYVRRLNAAERWPIPERHNASLIIRRDDFVALIQEAEKGSLGAIPNRSHPLGSANVEVSEEFFPGESHEEGDLSENEEVEISLDNDGNITAIELLDDVNEDIQVEFDGDNDNSDDDEGAIVHNSFIAASQTDDLDNISRARLYTYEKASSARQSFPVVSWDEWKHAACWVADAAHVSSWITVSAGQRYIGLDDEGHVIVQDFQQHVDEEAWSLGLNKILCKEAKHSEGAESNDQPGYDEVYWKGGQSVEHPSEEEIEELSKIFKDEDGFLKGIKYQKYVSKEKVGCRGIMMDEERIIGLHHDEDTGEIVALEVFQL